MIQRIQRKNSSPEIWQLCGKIISESRIHVYNYGDEKYSFSMTISVFYKIKYACISADT